MYVYEKFNYGIGYLNCVEVQYEIVYLKLKKLKNKEFC